MKNKSPEVVFGLGQAANFTHAFPPVTLFSLTTAILLNDGAETVQLGKFATVCTSPDSCGQKPDPANWVPV